MRLFRLASIWLLLSLSLFAQDPKSKPSSTLPTDQPSTSKDAPPPAAAEPAKPKIITAYTLPPELARKAHDRGKFELRFALISFVYGLVVLWLVLGWKLAPKYRDWAERVASKRFLQSLIYAPLLLLTLGVLTVPADIYGEWMEKRFGLSIQGWGSWAADWAKSQVIEMVVGAIFIWLLYAVIRHSPRRWWLYFWLCSLPIIMALIFLQPLVLDPLFHKFEPLQQKEPALTASLQQMVKRAGQDIPPERMFWMGAGEKTTTLNAYVVGIGSTKRLVLWDNTIAKMTTPEIVFVAGHEMGHYVLLHIPKLIAFSSLILLAIFYLGFRSIEGILARHGVGWGIEGVGDWASLPALLLLFSVFSFVTTPILNTVSRHYEHQADQYGLEVTHGLIPDNGQVGAQSLQVLGEVDLGDPNPNPWMVWLGYSHPPIPERVQYSLHYDPWEKGQQPEFVK